MPENAGELELLARRLEFHARLDAEDRKALLALPFQLRTFDPSHYLVRDGEPPRTCAILLSGFAFRQKLTFEGARQIVSVHIPGEALDFQNIFLDVADHSVQTLTRAKVAIISRDQIRAIAQERPGIGHAILMYNLVEASISREWITNIGRRSARARLAHLLCEFAIRIDTLRLYDGAPYELPMSQEQLADALGLTPVHLNRTLGTLRKDGLVESNHRMISFPNWDALCEVSGFSARYLHLVASTGK